MLFDYSRYAIFMIANIGISFLLLSSIANGLSIAAYADYGFSLSIASVLLIFVNFGHRDAIYKAISQRHYKLAYKLVMSGCLLVVVFLCLGGTYQIFSNSSLAWAVLSIGCLQLVNIISAYHRGKGNYACDGVTLPFYRGIWLLLLLLLLQLNQLAGADDVFKVATVAALVTWISMGGMRLLQGAFRNRKFNSKQKTRSAMLAFFLVEVCSVLFMRLDLFLLEYFDVVAEKVGLYFFSLQLFEAAILIITPVSILFYNRYNKNVSKNIKAESFCQSVIILVLIVMAGYLVWSSIGEWFLLQLFPKYNSAYELVGWLILALLPNGLNAILSVWLFAHDKMLMYASFLLIGIIVSIVISSLSISEYGVKSVAIARGIAETVMCTCMLVYFYNRKSVNV